MRTSASAENRPNSPASVKPAHLADCKKWFNAEEQKAHTSCISEQEMWHGQFYVNFADPEKERRSPKQTRTAKRSRGQPRSTQTRRTSPQKAPHRRNRNRNRASKRHRTTSSPKRRARTTHRTAGRVGRLEENHQATGQVLPRPLPAQKEAAEEAPQTLHREEHRRQPAGLRLRGFQSSRQRQGTANINRRSKRPSTSPSQESRWPTKKPN